MRWILKYKDSKSNKKREYDNISDLEFDDEHDVLRFKGKEIIDKVEGEYKTFSVGTTGSNLFIINEYHQDKVILEDIVQTEPFKETLLYWLSFEDLNFLETTFDISELEKHRLTDENLHNSREVFTYDQIKKTLKQLMYLLIVEKIEPEPILEMILKVIKKENEEQ